jgi:hypothetical protein
MVQAPGAKNAKDWTFEQNACRFIGELTTQKADRSELYVWLKNLKVVLGAVETDCGDASFFGILPAVLKLLW